MPTTTKTETATCPKCLGARVFTCWLGIDNGRCFTCAGTGTIEVREDRAARQPAMPRVSAEGRAWSNRQEVRNMYRAARDLGFNPADFCTDGYTMEWLVGKISEVPGALEAFRALRGEWMI